MSAAGDFLASVLADAKQVGPETEPSHLLNVAAQGDPLASLSTNDGGTELFGALTEEFGFLDIFRVPDAEPSEEARAQLTGLFRWVIRSLREWTRASDPNNQKLAAIFVVSRYCRHAGPFWSELPDTAGNSELLRELGAMLARIRIDISPGGFSHSPISDREAIERFNKADKDCEWAELSDQLHALAYLPGAFIPEATGYLHRFNRPLLLASISGIHQTFVLMQVLDGLTPAERCQLSLDTDNAHLDFCVVHRCLVPERWAREPKAIPPLLTNVLKKIAQNDDRWAQCMNAFNRYPMRHPELAPHLGQVLADVPEAAVRTYVKSVPLSALAGASRQAVADALEVFRSLASDERRTFLWREAFDRWSGWNFGAPETNGLTTNVALSDLDFAIVGYAAECMSPQEREAFARDICAKLSVLELTWHKSHSDFMAEKNRLLSAFQPIAHAMHEATSGKWLAPNTYLPFDKTKERYNAMLLGL